MDLLKLKVNKILLIFLFCMILLVQPTSAFEFDNVKSYNPNTKTATITNAFGFGSTIAEITLDSEQELLVLPGEHIIQLYTIENYEDYNNAFGELEFYNKNSGNKKFDKQFRYMYLDNGKWKPLNTNSQLKKGKITIGIEVTIEPGEKTEWIPNLFGERISEWAVFVGAVRYEFYLGPDDTRNPVRLNNWIAQTFRIGTTGPDDDFNLAGISLFINKTGSAITGLGGPIHFSIMVTGVNASDDPDYTNIIAVNTTFNITHWGNGILDWHNITMPNVLLDKDTNYTIILNQSFAPPGLANSTLIRYNSTGSLYAQANGGKFYTSADSGVTWDDGSPANRSILFQVWGELIVITSELISPVTGSTITDSSINFTANQTAIAGFNLKNATYKVWRDDLTLFDETTVSINESLNQTILQINDFTFDGYIWNVIACGQNTTTTVCDSAQSNFTFEVGINVTDLTFNNDTTEGSTESFKVNISVLSESTITETNFIYNNTKFVANFKSVGANKFQVERVITTPSISADVNKSFFFNFIFSGGESINTSINNQTVRALSIDECSAESTLILNFTLRDEENQTILDGALFNTSIEYSVEIFSLEDSIDPILNISNRSSKVNPTLICINNDLVNITYRLDSTIKYESEDRVVEYYNIQNFSLTNISIPQHISLFDLLDTDSTEFKLTFTGSDFLPAEDVLVFVEREYLSENNFKTVELPKTDTNGQTILHLVINDIIYNLVFVKNGILLKNFRNLRAFCDPAIELCTLSLNALSEDSAVVSYDEEIGIAFTSPPEFDNSTNRISFSYTSIDGQSKNISMRVERKDIFGNNTICSNSLNSISGTISCNIPSGITDTTLETTISVDGNEKIISQVTIDGSAFGSMGYVAFFLLTLGLVLAFSNDKNGILLALLISYLGSLALGLSVGGIIGVGSAGIWIIIITVIGLWRLNKNKFD